MPVDPPDRDRPEVPHISGPSPLPGDPGRSAEDLLGELEAEERLAEREEAANRRPMSYWWLALFILVLHSEAVAFSFNLVSPTLVPIATEFQTTQLGWMYTALTLVGAVSIPLTTKLADLYGKKRMILAVTAVATLGALLVATANSYTVVLVGRALEGTLLALIPLVYSLMRDIFPRRILAFSVTIAASGVGVVTICGPFIAGYLVDNHGWQSVFWFLFVEQLVGLIAILFVIPESPVRQRVRLDWAGALLLGGGLGVILLGISQGSAWGWTDARTLGCILGGLAVLALWVVAARRTTEPLMDLTVLRSRSVSAILAFGMLGQVALAGAATMLPILVQTPRELGIDYGFGVSATGLTQFTVPAGAATVVVGFVLAALIRRTGAKTPVLVGLVLQIIGCVGLALMHDTKGQVIGFFLLLGISQALVFSSVPALVIAAVPQRLQAVSAGMSGTTQTLGGAIGPAICFAILAANVGTLVQGQPIYTNHGLVVAYLATAVASVMTLLVALAVPRLRVPGDQAEAAERPRATASTAA